MTDTATLQARLEEAEGVLHDWIMGSRETAIAYNGRSLTYNQTNEAVLRRYIAELKRQLGQASGLRPLRPFFN